MAEIYSCRRNRCACRSMTGGKENQNRVAMKMSRLRIDNIGTARMHQDVSRREILKIVDELRQQLFAPKQPFADLPPRRRAMVNAAARGAVLLDSSAWNNPVAIQPFWQGPDPLPSHKELRGLARMAKATVPSLRDLDVEMGIWSGGFFRGLRLAGAMYQWHGRTRVLPGRPWLEEDLELMSLPGRLRPANHRGRWLCRCLAARVPATSEVGPDVVAGLLAGAKKHRSEDGNWLLVPRSDPILRLIDQWAISATEVRLPSRHGLERLGLRISPFYGLLFSGLMPVSTAYSMLVRRPGDCPWLPLAYWQVLHPDCCAQDNYFMPPRAGLYPYLCSHSTRRRLGLGREDLYRASVRLGVSFVPLGLRKLLEEWRQGVSVV
jgi:hypothetical protein